MEGERPFRTGEGFVFFDVGGEGTEEVLELHDAAHVLELELDQKAPAWYGWGGVRVRVER